MRGPTWAIVLSPIFLVGAGFVIRDGCVRTFAWTDRRASLALSQTETTAGETPPFATTLPRQDAHSSEASAPQSTEPEQSPGIPPTAALGWGTALFDGADVPDAGAPAFSLEPDGGVVPSVEVGAAPAVESSAARARDGGGEGVSRAPDASTGVPLPAPILGWSYAITSGGWSFGDGRSPSSLQWDTRWTSGAYSFSAEAVSTDASGEREPPSRIVLDLGLLRAGYFLSVVGAIDPTTLPGAAASSTQSLPSVTASPASTALSSSPSPPPLIPPQ